VGISKCLAAYCKQDTPNAGYADISAGDLKDAMSYGNLMGKKARSILNMAKGGLGARSPGINRIVLLSAAESEADAKGVLGGWYDWNLTEAGKKEAMNAGIMLKDENFMFDIAFTSLLRRSIHTSWNVLAESGNFSMPIMNSWRLNDRQQGTVTGLSMEEAMAKVDMSADPATTPAPAWPATSPMHPANDPKYKNVPKTALLGGESLVQVGNRVVPFFQDTIAPCVMAGKSVLVTAHSDSLKAIVAHLCDAPAFEAACLVRMAPGVPYIVEVDANLRVISQYSLDEEAAAKKLEISEMIMKQM